MYVGDLTVDVGVIFSHAVTLTFFRLTLPSPGRREAVGSASLMRWRLRCMALFGGNYDNTSLRLSELTLQCYH